jgi:hypothetical protein
MAIYLKTRGNKSSEKYTPEKKSITTNRAVATESAVLAFVKIITKTKPRDIIPNVEQTIVKTKGNHFSQL